MTPRYTLPQRRDASQYTAEDWNVLRQEIIESFTPGTPINETELFAGRRDRIQRLQDTVLEPGRHAVIYGERGVGKSSIANTFYTPLIQPTRQVCFIRINCDATDSFDSIWRKVFRRIKRETAQGTAVWADDAHPKTITVDDVMAELSDFGGNQYPIVVVDEFDRVKDLACGNLFTDLVKTLSDFTVHCTLVIVGVAANITELIANHGSISRSLVLVPIPRMKREELEDIVNVRLARMGMQIDENALWRVTFFSAGLPFYTHSIGKHAALLAVSSRRLKITEEDVFKSMQSCIADVDYKIHESYARATERIYRKANIFPEVLAGCALAEVDSLGNFTATSVEEPLSAICGEEMRTASFGFHLNELTRPERGSVLNKTGERRTYRFSFKEPLMQPYVIMVSLQSKVLTQEVIERFTIKRQRDLLSTLPALPSVRSPSGGED